MGMEKPALPRRSFLSDDHLGHRCADCRRVRRPGDRLCHRPGAEDDPRRVHGSRWGPRQGRDRPAHAVQRHRGTQDRMDRQPGEGLDLRAHDRRAGLHRHVEHLHPSGLPGALDRGQERLLLPLSRRRLRCAGQRGLRPPSPSLWTATRSRWTGSSSPFEERRMATRLGNWLDERFTGRECGKPSSCARSRRSTGSTPSAPPHCSWPSIKW